MQDKFNFFYNWVIGQSAEISDKSNPYQCMDLAYVYCLFLGFPKETIQHLYAFEVYTKVTDVTRQYFDIIPNTPSGVPQVGDLIVFSNKNQNGTYFNTAGHISISNGTGDINLFQSIDQNWVSGQKVTLVTHNYDSPRVLGWLRPKIVSQTPVITDQTKIPQIDNMEVQAIRSKLNDQQQAIGFLSEKFNQIKLIVG